MSSNEWKQVKLSEVCEYGKDKLNINDLELTNYISTENMLPEKAGVTIASGLPISKTLPAFKMGDVLVSNIRPYSKKYGLRIKLGAAQMMYLYLEQKETSMIINFYIITYLLMVFLIIQCQHLKELKCPVVINQH
ncbi:MAG: hypothetical protein ACOXZ6_01990 [Syntrophomonadaceae bacterium]